MGVLIIGKGMFLNTQASHRPSTAYMPRSACSRRGRESGTEPWPAHAANAAISGVGTVGENTTFYRCPPTASTAPTGTNPVKGCAGLAFREVFWRARARAARSCLQQPLLHKTSNGRADEGSSKADDDDAKYRAQKRAARR